MANPPGQGNPGLVPPSQEQQQPQAPPPHQMPQQPPGLQQPPYQGYPQPSNMGNGKMFLISQPRHSSRLDYNSFSIISYEYLANLIYQVSILRTPNRSHLLVLAKHEQIVDPPALGLDLLRLSRITRFRIKTQDHPSWEDQVRRLSLHSRQFLMLATSLPIWTQISFVQIRNERGSTGSQSSILASDEYLT